MRKFFCLLILLLCLTRVVLSQPAYHAFIFTGKVINPQEHFVFLNYIDTANHYMRDSSVLVNGAFTFKGYVSGPVMARFSGNNISGSGDDPRTTNLFIEPGKIHAVFPDNDFKHSVVTGSKSQTDYAAYVKQLDKPDVQFKGVLNASKAYKQGIDEEKNRAITDKGIPLYNNERTKITRQFIRSNSQSYVSASLLQYEMFKLSLDSLKIYFHRLLPAVRNSNDGRLVGEFIRKEEAIAIGQPAPDFMQPDTSGTNVWLHDFKGKYVLLDMWASWCVPCRAESPFLRQAYSNFKDKGFTILSLSIDRPEDKTAWLAAIAKDNLTWPQLCDFTSFQNKVVNAYNVWGKGIPANFLISPDGIILAMNLRGEEIEKKLSQLIK